MVPDQHPLAFSRNWTEEGAQRSLEIFESGGICLALCRLLRRHLSLEDGEHVVHRLARRHRLIEFGFQLLLVPLLKQLPERLPMFDRRLEHIRTDSLREDWREDDHERHRHQDDRHHSKSGERFVQKLPGGCACHGQAILRRVRATIHSLVTLQRNEKARRQSAIANSTW